MHDNLELQVSVVLVLLEHIEKQQAELIKELSQANTNINLCLVSSAVLLSLSCLYFSFMQSELKHVEQQLGHSWT